MNGIKIIIFKFLQAKTQAQNKTFVDFCEVKLFLYTVVL